MRVADFIAAPAFAVLGLWMIWMGVRIWRTSGGVTPLPLEVSGGDRVSLVAGFTVVLLAVMTLAMGIAPNIAKAPIADLWIFRVSGISMIVFTFLTLGVLFFSVPRFLVPPHLRHQGGQWRRSRPAEHSRRR